MARAGQGWKGARGPVVRLSRRVPKAFARCIQVRSTQPASRGLLLVMAALILAMPMSYRAGTAFSHPHAFFQVIIDAATGHSHHDADELVGGARPDHARTFALFVPPAIPLQHLGAGHDAAWSAGESPDTPALTAVSAPLEQAASIPALSLIILLLLAADRRRSIWALVPVPRGAISFVEPPPPRHAP